MIYGCYRCDSGRLSSLLCSVLFIVVVRLSGVWKVGRLLGRWFVLKLSGGWVRKFFSSVVGFSVVLDVCDVIFIGMGIGCVLILVFGFG